MYLYRVKRGGVNGYVLAISEYEPGSEYTYYWGSAWDKATIKTADAWNIWLNMRKDCVLRW